MERDGTHPIPLQGICWHSWSEAICCLKTAQQQTQLLTLLFPLPLSNVMSRFGKRGQFELQAGCCPLHQEIWVSGRRKISHTETQEVPGLYWIVKNPLSGQEESSLGYCTLGQMKPFAGRGKLLIFWDGLSICNRERYFSSTESRSARLC